MSVKSINRQYKEHQKNDEWRASIHQYMQQQCNNQKLHVESEYAQFYKLIWSDNQNNKAFDFVAMKIESFDQSEARNRQRIIRPWAKIKHTQSAHREFTHQVWVESDKQFFCKCLKTVWTIRCQEMVRIQWTRCECQMAVGSGGLNACWS